MNKNYHEYYKYIIEVNKTGGWSSLYYGVFSKVINDNNFKNCAEVGIGYGLHAHEILENTNVENLYLIEPSVTYPDDGFPKDVMENLGFDELNINIKQHLKLYEDRYKWIKKRSLEVSDEDIPIESLDSVFIDGDHSYEAVRSDIPFWWKKLRPGGWLLGDDYGRPGVAKAVQEFVKENGLEFEFLYKEGTDYPIYKIIKKL